MYACLLPHFLCAISINKSPVMYLVNIIFLVYANNSPLEAIGEGYALIVRYDNILMEH